MFLLLQKMHIANLMSLSLDLTRFYNPPLFFFFPQKSLLTNLVTLADISTRSALDTALQIKANGYMSWERRFGQLTTSVQRLSCSCVS